MFKSIEAVYYKEIDEGKLNFLQSKGQEFDVIAVSNGKYNVPYVKSGIEFSEKAKSDLVAYATKKANEMELTNLLSWSLKIVGKMSKSFTYDIIFTNSKGLNFVLRNAYFGKNDVINHHNSVIVEPN